MTNEPSVNLIRSIIENMSVVPADWDSFAVIVDSFQGKFNSVSGYAYSANGTISPFATDPWKVIPFVDAYIESTYTPDQAVPVKFLVEFVRSTGSYRVTFEDTDESRWKVTPKNYKELRESLRPHFE